MYAATSAPLPPPPPSHHTATPPSCARRLNLLENFPSVSRSERPLDAETVQSHIFHGEIANGVHASKSGFICHPMKHSQIQSVNYGAINYYLQTSMKYVHSLRKQVDLSMTVFHDQVRGERLSQSFFLCNRNKLGLPGASAMAALKSKREIFPRRWKDKLVLSTVRPSDFSDRAVFPLLFFSRTRHLFITFRPSIIPSREKRDRRE